MPATLARVPNMRSATCALCALLLLAPAPATAGLTPAEQAMVRTVDAEQERTVEMLGRWVDQNSGSMNFAGVKAVGDMLRRELEPLGFTVEWIDMRSANRAGHIVARQFLAAAKAARNSC